jgi:hypothetical protein
MFAFLGFHKNGLIKIYSQVENIWACKISCSHIDWCKFCIYLERLNVQHFGVVKTKGIKEYGVKVTSNAMASILNFIKVY